MFSEEQADRRNGSLGLTAAHKKSDKRNVLCAHIPADPQQASSIKPAHLWGNAESAMVSRVGMLHCQRSVLTIGDFDLAFILQR